MRRLGEETEYCVRKTKLEGKPVEATGEILMEQSEKHRFGCAAYTFSQVCDD